MLVKNVIVYNYKLYKRAIKKTTYFDKLDFVKQTYYFIDA